MKQDLFDYGVVLFSISSKGTMTGHYSTKHVCLDMAQVGDEWVKPFIILESYEEKFSGIAQRKPYK